MRSVILLAQVGHDLRSTLETYRDVGNTEEVLRMVREYKAGSLAMQPQQRRHMLGSCFFKDKQVRHAPLADDAFPCWAVR